MRQQKSWLASTSPLMGLFWLAANSIALLNSSQAAPADQAWKAGAAKVQITPTEPMPMAGYGSRKDGHADGTLHDLWAKALWLEDAQGKQGLLVTMDLCGIDRQFSARIKQRLRDSLGLDTAAIILSVSHTHSGPVVSRYLAPMHYHLLSPADQLRVDSYADALVEKLVACAMQAKSKAAPSRLMHATGQATFAANRRNNPQDQVEQLRAAGRLVGPVDHSVPVLAVYQEDRLVATAIGYACHATTLGGMQWSSDYAGIAQTALEADHPGSIALFWAGCGADQNPLPRRSVDLVELYGRQLADAVSEALRGLPEPIAPKLDCQYREIDLALAKLPSEEQLRADLQSDNVYTMSRARMLLAQVEAGQPLSPTYPYPVATWRLGNEVRWAVLGGEVVVDYAIAVKSLTEESRPAYAQASGPSDDASSAPRWPVAETGPQPATWVMGYANDVMAYIPSRRVLREGGYEGGGAMVYYGLPSVWAPEIESDITEEVARQFRATSPGLAKGVFPVEAMPHMLQENGAGEGPLWMPGLGLLTSGDGHVMLRSPNGHQSIYLENAGTNGLARDAQGRLLLCQNVLRQITRMQGNEFVTLTDKFDGMPYNQPNDLTLDSRGRIYFTDPQYGPRDKMAMLDSSGKHVEGVYRIDPDGSVTRIITHEVDRPNGLVVSADDRYLFVADNNNNTVGGARKLWRFLLTEEGDIDRDSQKLLYDWGDTRGPDGMELDTQGRLYVAAGSNRQNPPYETQAQPTAGVYVFSAEGQLLDFVAIARDEVTNVAFGGPERRTLFVTAGGTLWSMPTLAPGR